MTCYSLVGNTHKVLEDKPIIFRYPGGKALPSAQSHILRLLPDRFAEYREPFVGGGGIFWSLTAEQGFKMRRLNDLDANLVMVYQALRDRPDEFLAACRAILPHSAADPHVQIGMQKFNVRLLGEFDRLLRDDSADPALRFFYLNRTSRNGRVMYDYPKRTTFAHNRGWDVVFDDNRMRRAARHLAGARVTAGDFEELFYAPGENVLIFADPPYLRPRAASLDQRLYQHEFASRDHERLAHVAHQSPHKILMSYNDCDTIRFLYRDWHLVTAEWAYVGQAGERKKRGSELLLANFEITQAPSKPVQAWAVWGAQGGSSTSPAKQKAARANGLKGGRTRGTSQSPEARAKISEARRKQADC